LKKRNLDQNERPFVLTRSFFAGSQRYAAVWTGDNTANWEHLAAANPMLLSLNLAGITFSGADVGGFFGNPDPQLLTRWYQAAAFHPFFRAHAHIDTKRREPYLYEEPYLSSIVSAIRMRYRFLPYWYTTFHTTSKTGIPLMRALWTEYPHESATFNMDDQFLIGSDILVKPVTKADQFETSVYLPPGEWYEISSQTVESGPATITVSTPLDKMPVFFRGGSIIPTKERPRRSSTQMIADPYTLLISLDHTKKAKGNLYVDDGHTFNYQEGEFLEGQFSYESNRQIKYKITNGSLRPSNVIERIVVLGLDSKPSTISFNNHNLDFDYDSQLNRLTIRKPLAPLSSEWTITIA